MNSSGKISLLLHGRGTDMNPLNRFERLDVAPEMDEFDPESSGPKTQFFHDSTRNIIAANDSPDVGFEASINPYRGCEHGCIYCYARPTHEYLGFSSGLDFESRIMVKMQAAKLLRGELSKRKWKPKVLSMSGVTDCYQPVERRLRITRSCLEVLAEFRNPVTIITKSHLVTRDIDILKTLASENLTAVMISITSLDKEIARVMEPRAASPARRLEAVSELAAAGIPVGVMAAPVIPGLTDHEMPELLKAAAAAGAKFCGYTSVRLPFAVKDLFADWLGAHFPDRKEKVLNRIRELHHGKLNESNFGSRMTGHGPWADQIKQIFALARRQNGLDQPFPKLSVDAFRPAKSAQMTLW
jgi:DNA repair photolyase